jgi:hypothetical protein
MRSIPVLLLGVLLVACGVPAAGSAGTPLNPTAPLAPTATGATSVPAHATAATPAFTATPTMTFTPTALPDPRWYWAAPVGKNEILAFNAAGQANSILDLTGINQEGNDSPPIRLSEDLAFILFNNAGHPKAFLLRSDSATPIQLPDVYVAVPSNGWHIHTENYPYIVTEAIYGATVPTIMINVENGQASLVAQNAFVGNDYSTYFIRLSEDGKSLRYATGDGPVEIHNRDLQSGKDTVFFETSSYVATDAFGDIWYDVRQDRGKTADGQTVMMMDTDGNTRFILLDHNLILSAKRTCTQPCPLQVSPAFGDAAALNFSLPVDLSAYVVGLSYGKLLDQNRLLVSIYDNNPGADQTPALWLLTPTGQSELLGKGASSSGYRSSSMSADGRYLLVYPPDDSPVFLVYDLQTGKVLFSGTTDEPLAYLEVYYFAEGVTVLPYSDTANLLWVYNFTTGLTSRVDLLDENEYCTAMTVNGKLICSTTGGVVVLDPATAESTPLLQGPVNSLSD